MKRFVKRLIQAKPRKEAEELRFHLDRVNKSAFSEIQKKYKEVDPYPGSSKYLDIGVWMQTALSRARLLKMAQRKRSTILDLGAGAAYFPFICQNLGHKVMALDCEELELYRALTSCLGVKRIEHTIRPFEPLPPSAVRYDLITAFSICFNGHDTPALWGVKEWDFILGDLCEHYAHPDTEIFFIFNREPSGEFYSQALQQYFQANGGECSGNRVRLLARNLME